MDMKTKAVCLSLAREHQHGGVAQGPISALAVVLPPWYSANWFPNTQCPATESILWSLQLVAVKELVKFKMTRKLFRQVQPSQPDPDAKKADGSNMQIGVVPLHMWVRFLLTK